MILVLLIFLILSIVCKSSGAVKVVNDDEVGGIDVVYDLVVDVINSRVDDNVVLVTDDGADDILYRTKKPLITMKRSDLTNTELELLLDVHRTNTLPLFFVLISQQYRDLNYTRDQIKMIQDVIYTARVAVVVGDVVNIEDFFHGLEIKVNDDYKNVATNFTISNTTSNPNNRQTLYDTYIFIPQLGNDSYYLYEMCRFCDNGKDEILQLNEWNKEDKFKYDLNFPFSFKDNFYGAEIKMGIDPYEEEFFVKSLNTSGEVIYDGYIYKYYLMLGTLLNCTWKFLSDPYYFLSYETANDFVSEKIDVDVIGGQYAPGFSGWLLVDYSSYGDFKQGEHIVSMAPSKALTWLTVFKPFDIYTWICLLISAPITGLTLYFLRKFSSVPNKKANLSDDIYDIVKILCWDSVKTSHPPCSVIIVLFVFMFITMVLITGYMGIYTAIITVPKFTHPPIDTFEQLWETDLKWLAASEFAVDWYMEMYFANQSKIRERGKALLKPYDDDPFLQMTKFFISNPHDLVLFEWKDSIDKYLEDGYINKTDFEFHYSKETFPDEYGSLILRKTCYFKDYLNRNVLNLYDHGISYYKLLEFGVPSYKEESSIDTSTSVKLVHLSGGFIILMIGFIISCLSFICECIFIKVFPKGNTLCE